MPGSIETTVAVMQNSMENCRTQTRARLDTLEGDMDRLSKNFDKHCNQERVRAARALFWQAIIVGLLAFAGALVGKLL